VSDPPPAEVTAEGDRPAGAAVAAAVLREVAQGGVRLVWRWPGLVVVVAVYAGVALGLYHEHYPNLWGGLAAALAAMAWYGSPLRALEARRRQRLAPTGPPEAQPR